MGLPLRLIGAVAQIRENLVMKVSPVTVLTRMSSNRGHPTASDSRQGYHDSLIIHRMPLSAKSRVRPSVAGHRLLVGGRCLSSSHSAAMSQDIVQATNSGGGACPVWPLHRRCSRVGTSQSNPARPRPRYFGALGLRAPQVIQGRRARGLRAALAETSVLLAPGRRQRPRTDREAALRARHRRI